MPVFDHERVERLKQILKWHPRGMTISDLAARLEMNRNLVAKYLDILLISGQVDMQVIGASKVYFLSQRVPVTSMLEFSSDMLIILDSSQKIIQVNEPLLVQVHEKKEALTGRKLREIDHPFLNAIPETLPYKGADPATDQVREFECALEGKLHYYRLKQLPTAFEDGSQGTTLIIEDITEQITYQKRLELNEAKYRGIVEDQTEFITRFLPDGTLIFINDAYARYLGKDKEQLLGGNHIPDIESQDIASVRQSILSLDTENPVVTLECRIHHSGGQSRWNLWTVRALFDDKKKPVEYQGVGRDNTEKREAATRINQYVRDLEFLSRKAQELVGISADADIFEAIARGLSELLPGAVVGVNSYDSLNETITVRSLFPDTDRQIISSFLGREYLGFQFKLNSVPASLRTFALNTIREGKIFHTDESLYNFFFQQIPEDICDRIKETLNLGDRYYGIGLIRHGILFGAVAFSLRKGEALHNSPLIETYIRQASIVLHRRHTDDALKASEARYRGIIEDQTELITRFLPDGSLTYVNDSVCRYFQKDLTELLGRSLFFMIPNEDKDGLLQNIQSLSKQTPVLTAEHRVLDSSGNIRWTQWTNRALFDDHGTIVEYQGVGRDITEQKAAEDKIRQYIADIEFLSQKSYEFLELPMDADIYRTICHGVRDLLPNAIVVINSDDPVTNLATTQYILGDEERDVFNTLIGKEVIGMKVKLPEPDELQKERIAVMSRKLIKVPGNLFVAVHNQVPEEICTKIEKALNIGDIYSIGLVFQGIIWASVVIMLRKGEMITHTDLIEAYMAHASIALLRYRTENTLKQSEKLYRSVIENIQDVFYRSDKQGTLIMASPSWARLLGYNSLDDCIGYNIAEKFYFEPQQRKEFLDTVYRDGSVSDYEVILKCRDGSPLHVSTNSHLYYDEAGSLLGVEGIFRDSSERYASAEKIQHHVRQMEFFSQKLQEFIELSPETDIFEKIATDLKLLVGDAMISVTSFNEDTGMLKCRSCLGDDYRAVCSRYLGQDLREIDYPLDPESFRTLSTGLLHKVHYSLYDLLFRKIPKETCDQIEESIKIGDIYGIGFVRRDQLFGSATIVLLNGAAICDIQLIETYARAASIALQRKIAEDSLKESQEIFSSVAKYAPVPIAIIDPDGRYEFVNQKFIDIFGYDLNDFKTGKEWFFLAYPDAAYRKKVIAAWKSDLETSISTQQRTETFTVRCKNGVDREIVFRPVTLSGNKQCVVYEDITDQQAAEQVRKLLFSIVETSPDAIITKKTDGTITSWNQAAERLYGYSKDEIIGRNISMIVPQERHGEIAEVFTRIKNGESPVNLETLQVRKDGKVIDVEVIISPITDETGTVIGASTIARDISLKKSEDRLRESEEKYRVHVENMNIGIYRSTGDPRGRFVWGNSSLVKIFGFPSFDTLQKIAVADIFTEPDGRKKLLEDLKRFGFVQNRQISMIRADGTPICVRVTALAKFDLAGKIEFINGIVEDVTTKKQTSPQTQRFRHELVDLIECLPDPTFVVSKDHQVIAWNAAMELMTGVPKSEIIGSEEFEHVFPKNISSCSIFIDLINLINAADDEIGKHDPPITREGSSLVTESYLPSLYSGRGSYVWAKASPLIDNDGRRNGAVEVIHDISKVKERYQLLQNATTGYIPETDEEISIPDAVYPVLHDHETIKRNGNEKQLCLSNALKRAQDYIAILDRSGKCLWVNDALVTAVNAASCSDLAGKSIALYIAPEFRKLALDSLMDVKKRGNKTVPFMILSSSGRVPVEANISAINTEEGDFFGYMAIARHVNRGKIEKPRNEK
jgi:PAS domain S-box-containing protein